MRDWVIHGSFEDIYNVLDEMRTRTVKYKNLLINRKIEAVDLIAFRNGRYCIHVESANEQGYLALREAIITPGFNGSNEVIYYYYSTINSEITLTSENKETLINFLYAMERVENSIRELIPIIENNLNLALSSPNLQREPQFDELDSLQQRIPPAVARVNIGTTTTRFVNNQNRRSLQSARVFSPPETARLAMIKLDQLSFLELNKKVWDSTISNQDILNEAGFRYENMEIKDFEFVNLIAKMRDKHGLIFPAKLKHDAPEVRNNFFEQVRSELQRLQALRRNFWILNSMDDFILLSEKILELELSNLSENEQNLLIPIIARLSISLNNKELKDKMQNIAREFLTFSVKEQAKKSYDDRIKQIKFKESQIPFEYKCTISHEMMDDPVFTPYIKEQKYDRKSIEIWLKINSHDPIKGQKYPLWPKDLISDKDLHDEIERFVTEQEKGSDAAAKKIQRWYRRK